MQCCYVSSQFMYLIVCSHTRGLSKFTMFDITVTRIECLKVLGGTLHRSSRSITRHHGTATERTAEQSWELWTKLISFFSQQVHLLRKTWKWNVLCSTFVFVWVVCSRNQRATFWEKWEAGNDFKAYFKLSDKYVLTLGSVSNNWKVAKGTLPWFDTSQKHSRFLGHVMKLIKSRSWHLAVFSNIWQASYNNRPRCEPGDKQPMVQGVVCKKWTEV